jgi:pseudaminic acid biosynthesis-associated methylase
MKSPTSQELFWSTDFGNEYIDRNSGESLISSNVRLFSKILDKTDGVNSISELGCNIGLNLIALNRINKNFDLRGYEINSKATEIAKSLQIAEIIENSVINKLEDTKKFDLCFTKGVLIHINPSLLNAVYQNLYDMSKKYIMVCEYYSPTPVSIEYRGHNDKLFKRDFAGELIAKFDLKLIDYGFQYKLDRNCIGSDSTWFLLKK